MSGAARLTRHRAPSALTKRGKVRTTIYLYPEEIKRLEVECTRERPKASDGRFGISSLVQRIVRAHLGLPPLAEL